MPQYRIIPPEGEVIEVPGMVPSAALDLASQKGVTRADLYDGDRYILTLRRDGAINACWTIVTEPADRAVGEAEPG